jgi:hypothetical protein
MQFDQHPVAPQALKVSSLPGQLLDCNTAIAAKMLAGTASDAGRDEGHRLLPAIQTGPNSVSLDPAWSHRHPNHPIRSREATGEPPDLDAAE